MAIYILYLNITIKVRSIICFNRDKNPEPRVFEEMAQSILAYFPITKGSAGFEWVIYTPFLF